MRVVKIHFSGWLQGEADLSALLRTEDGLRCCLGFYEEAIGVPVEAREDVTTPANSFWRWRGLLKPTNTDFWAAEAEWLIDRDDDPKFALHVDDSDECCELMNLNDRPYVDPYDDRPSDYFTFILDKMREIGEIFARHDVQIEWLLA